MNEQVKELIKQAGLNIDGFGDPIWGGLCAADKTKFLEKYTELIVKECAYMCHDQALAESERGSVASVHKEQVLAAMGLKIAKHFEVRT